MLSANGMSTTAAIGGMLAASGRVYNPRDGKTNRIEMKVLDRETLKIRGYIGIPLLGQSQICKRAHGEARPAFALR